MGLLIIGGVAFVCPNVSFCDQWGKKNKNKTKVEELDTQMKPDRNLLLQKESQSLR